LVTGLRSGNERGEKVKKGVLMGIVHCPSTGSYYETIEELSTVAFVQTVNR
jgi:hypothetical protein